MSHADEPGPDAAWAAAQWQPAPDVSPMPVQRQPADPLVPGWGVAEPGSLPPPPTRLTDEPARRPDRTMVWVAGAAIVVAGLVFAGVAVGGGLFARSTQHELGTVSYVQVTTQLISAGDAIALYRAQTGADPTDLASLGEYGFRPSSDVTVQIVPVASGYCLAGGPAGQPPTAWYSDGRGLATSPCG